MIVWRKFLSDGTVEAATDDSLFTGRSSWTRGRHDILGVELYLNGKGVAIQGDGEVLEGLEQFDHCVVSGGNPTPRIVARTLVLKDELGLFTFSNEKRQGGTLTVYKMVRGRPTGRSSVVTFRVEAHGDVLMVRQEEID
jgi:hypothetical protein